jgi:dihydroorotate dehydrogenase (NAD+) catalytic subunit
MECLTAQRSDTRLHAPIYDPSMSYQDNFDRGPFGEFANGVRIDQAGKPQHSFLSHSVFAPFGVPAGPLLNGKFVKAALDKGFDIPVYKTVRTRRVPCHAWPNVLAVDVEGDLTLDKTRLAAKDDYAEPLSITNSFGVPSFDPDFWQPDMADAVAHAGPGQVVVGSFQGTKSERGGAADYIADFVLGARLIRETGVKIVEVNLSCPNEGTSALLCFDVERSGEIVNEIKNVLGEIPLVIKVAYFRDDASVEKLVRAVSGAVSGISAINTISAEIVDEHGQQALPGEGRLRSGVCGRSIKWAGLEMTKRLNRVRELVGTEFSIIGVGGVSDAADYEEYRRAGADAVMAATAMMWNPLLAQQIKREAHEL